MPRLYETTDNDVPADLTGNRAYEMRETRRPVGSNSHDTSSRRRRRSSLADTAILFPNGPTSSTPNQYGAQASDVFLVPSSSTSGALTSPTAWRHDRSPSPAALRLAANFSAKRGRWKLALVVTGTLIVVAVLLLIASSTSSPHVSNQVLKKLAEKVKAIKADPDGAYVFSPDFRKGETYREKLERTTSAPGQIGHLPTLTFDHIYVLSLPKRKDRRAQMDQMAAALGLTITYVDALDKHDPVIQWIAEQVYETRELKRQIMSNYTKTPPEKLGGMGTESVWFSLTQDPHDPESPALPEFSPYGKAGKKTWIEVLEEHIKKGTTDELKPKRGSLDVLELLWDPLEEIEQRQINEGVLSTTYGHLLAMQTAIDNGDQSALILEDDIDIEWDIQRMWARILHALPPWDITLIGHCWGYELTQPAKNNPLLHPSTHPLCLHAYALTYEGMRNFKTQLTNPWVAYVSPVDNYIPFLLRHEKIRSFSVEPPLIIQRKESASDIQEGSGSIWRGLLQDSTFERILISENKPIPPLPYTDEQPDPATKLRGKLITKQCA